MTRTEYRRQLWLSSLIALFTFALVLAGGIVGTVDWRWPW